MDPVCRDRSSVSYLAEMYALLELRRGDIVQTWALTRSWEVATQHLASLMSNLPPAATRLSWWKIVEFDMPDNLFNVPVGTLLYTAVEVDWEDDNEVRIVGVFDQLERVPQEVHESEDIWIDHVRLIGFNPRNIIPPVDRFD